MVRFHSNSQRRHGVCATAIGNILRIFVLHLQIFEFKQKSKVHRNIKTLLDPSKPSILPINVMVLFIM